MFGISSFCSICCVIAAVFQPNLSVTESSKTIDQPLQIYVEGLQPFQVVELKTKAVDQKEEIWTSHAYFQADKNGYINLKKDQPLPGSSYDTIDEMGLFWSMLPSNNSSASFKCKQDRFVVDLTLYQEEKVLIKKTITHFLKKPNVKRIEVKERGLVGTLFLPPSETPLPVIITLSGSNGGISENRAKLLASNGFAVLALGVFGVEGLPSNLQNIPLEYFETAFSWLKTQSQIDSTRVGLYGVSRGAELALLLGSYFPNSIQGIAAIAPSSVVYGALGDPSTPAWTYQGKAVLPCAPIAQTDFKENIGQSSKQPASTRQSFLSGMKDQSAFEAAAIPVENIQCPLLLISGGDDQMWPSDIYVQQLLNRLKKNNSKVPCQHFHYPLAGHGINIPNLPIPEPTYYHPIGKLWFSMGGTRAADAQASQDAWNEIVAFFHEVL
ncbi:MAG: acyl-CoA thioesterase/bile acid-CoA:amino acid N-acyltransferase family protein [Chlamydiota bacterium]|jgi:dienelactone hydrolase